MTAKTDGGVKVVAQNRRAAHDYFIEDRFEAGIVLLGSEIKSIRAGRVQLREAYVRTDPARGEVLLLNAHIAPYDPAARQNHDPLRDRKLLLHKKEIARLTEKVQQKGYTIIPLKIYITAQGRAKIEIALAKGKRQYDKRQAIAKRDSQREIERALGRRDGK